MKEKLKDILIGYTKDDYEKIFKTTILPIYYFQISMPNVSPKWKVGDIETGKEFDKQVDDNKLLNI